MYDPICGMLVNPATAAGSSTHNGETYHFCSPACKAEFDKNPAQFASPAPAASACCGGSGVCH